MTVIKSLLVSMSPIWTLCSRLVHKYPEGVKFDVNQTITYINLLIEVN